MIRRILLLAVCIGCACSGTITLGSPGPDVISEQAAQQHGLTRAWFTQVQVDSSRGRLGELILDEGTLFLVSDQSVVTGIDAATGVTRWTVEVGNRNYPAFTPAANRKFVAVVNGSSLYVLNRVNGKLLWKTKLDGAPGAGPALSQQRVYVPLLDGRLAAYRLLPVKEEVSEAAQKEVLTAEQRAARDLARLDSLRLEQDVPPPLYAQVPGRALIQPVVTRENEGEENVVWATDQGYLCAGRIDRKDQKALELRYRLHTDAPIVAQPSYLPPDANVLSDSGLVVAGSEDGFVYGIRERNGEQVWRFSTGEPIVEDPVVLGRFVFVANQLGGMYCVDAKSGSQVWWTPEVTRFIAASKERVYATDKIGLLHVLSARTGTGLDTIAATMLPIKLTNPESDRLFLASTTGMIQCLHEPEMTQSLVRKIPPKEIEPSTTLASAKAASKEESSEESKEPTHTASSKHSGSSGGGSKSSGSKSSGGSKLGGTKSGASKTAGAKSKKGGMGDFGGAGAGGGKKRKKGKGGLDAGAMPGMIPGAAKQ